MPRFSRAGLLRPALVFLAAGLTGGTVQAATPPDSPAEILQQMRSFREMGTVLYLAAHPDDENTELIAYFSRGRGYRTAYLSVTRGDGGQNELGPEFGEKLGVARTQELLAARRLDGGRQFFTRAIDFGFSKSPQETLEIWDHDEVLADVVRVVREFQPDVIITRFPVPPGSGGHGHHTASAMLAVEAFKLAGEPTAYPEQLREGLTPWQPKRVLWNSFNFGNRPLPLPGPVFHTDIAGTDAATGESFGSIAARSRAMHKTQGLGGFTSRVGGGPNVQNFLLLAGEPANGDVMDGVDLTWGRIPGGAEIDRLVADVIAAFKPDDPAASLPALLAIRAKIAVLPDGPLVSDKRHQLDGILQGCLGLQVETLVPEAEAMAGDVLKLHQAVSMHADFPVRWAAVRYPSLKIETKVGTDLAAGQPASEEATATLPATTPVSQPYWLRSDGTAGTFRVDDATLIGRPENPPVLPVEYVFAVGGQALVVADEPVQIEAGAPAAQARRPLVVIPPVALKFVHEVELFAPGATRPVLVEVTADRAGVHGKLQLNVPAGWTSAPATEPFRLNAGGESVRVTFNVTAPGQPATGEIGAVAEVNGRKFENQRVVISYPHLPVQLLQPAARLKAVALNLATRGQRVGYLPGAGDSTADSLEQMGYAVTTLTGLDLTLEKLHGFDAVVIGVRAFNERTDLTDNLAGLFAYVAGGGTVIVQYNRPNGLKVPKLGPYDLSIAGDAPRYRVTDENSPVVFLAPDHPALTTPNRIVPADFDHWVQERGAYFPSSWDETHYTALLAMSDPAEAPLKSSLLVARYGKGYYVYTGLAFFRQLPAGVPGAYRLFANLVSLGKE
jgi:LmbE family N-acetylglucosaminyl deacetylase